MPARSSPAFEEFVRSFGLEGRLRFHAGDLFVDPLPHADVFVMGHILLDWGRDEKRALLAAECQRWMRDAGFRETSVAHLAGPDSMHRDRSLLRSVHLVIDSSSVCRVAPCG